MKSGSSKMSIGKGITGISSRMNRNRSHCYMLKAGTWKLLC
jgi:hypothetical protein